MVGEVVVDLAGGDFASRNPFPAEKDALVRDGACQLPEQLHFGWTSFRGAGQLNQKGVLHDSTLLFDIQRAVKIGS